MNLVAVTACPTGIAHTYMAAERLEKAGRKLGLSIKVETQGAMGIENELEPGGHPERRRRRVRRGHRRPEARPFRGKKDHRDRRPGRHQEARRDPGEDQGRPWRLSARSPFPCRWAFTPAPRAASRSWRRGSARRSRGRTSAPALRRTREASCPCSRPIRRAMIPAACGPTARTKPRRSPPSRGSSRPISPGSNPKRKRPLPRRKPAPSRPGSSPSRGRSFSAALRPRRGLSAVRPSFTILPSLPISRRLPLPGRRPRNRPLSAARSAPSRPIFSPGAKRRRMRRSGPSSTRTWRSSAIRPSRPRSTKPSAGDGLSAAGAVARASRHFSYRSPRLPERLSARADGRYPRRLPSAHRAPRRGGRLRTGTSVSRRRPSSSPKTWRPPNSWPSTGPGCSGSSWKIPERPHTHSSSPGPEESPPSPGSSRSGINCSRAKRS